MKVSVTADELINRGVWDKVCELKGLNPWCVNEGQMDSDEYITLTIEQAHKLGILKGQL